ncbi:hypothetical protein CHS0354_013356 [Potamilus streckersoni]|uniref:Uncharacterized protein n=1 Tax=Potamilus streckersoni TaxID=2493646 RepID=A0AAE0T2L6_9BIVA|nr:hypothetical protein CHS0354_013356 [Potamilus streckersoni]
MVSYALDLHRVQDGIVCSGLTQSTESYRMLWTYTEYMMVSYALDLHRVQDGIVCSGLTQSTGWYQITVTRAL